MMKAKATHQNKFIKIITMPMKALAKARDFYVRSMMNYADKVSYGPYSGSAGYTEAFPRSVSTSSTRSNETEDFKELVRAASTSTLGNRVDLGSILTTSRTTNSRGSALYLEPKKKANVNGFRSASVGMAKIEEDKPIEFCEGNYHGQTSFKKKITRFFPRSKSVVSIGPQPSA